MFLTSRKEYIKALSRDLCSALLPSPAALNTSARSPVCTPHIPAGSAPAGTAGSAVLGRGCPRSGRSSAAVLGALHAFLCSQALPRDLAHPPLIDETQAKGAGSAERTMLSKSKRGGNKTLLTMSC